MSKGTEVGAVRCPERGRIAVGGSRGGRLVSDLRNRVRRKADTFVSAFVSEPAICQRPSVCVVSNGPPLLSVMTRRF